MPVLQGLIRSLTHQLQALAEAIQVLLTLAPLPLSLAALHTQTATFVELSLKISRNLPGLEARIGL